jgi:hypothetical protein
MILEILESGHYHNLMMRNLNRRKSMSISISKDEYLAIFMEEKTSKCV